MQNVFAMEVLKLKPEHQVLAFYPTSDLFYILYLFHTVRLLYKNPCGLIRLFQK